MRALARPLKQSKTVIINEHEHGEASWKGGSGLIVGLSRRRNGGILKLRLLVLTLGSENETSGRAKRNPFKASSGERFKYIICQLQIRKIAFARLEVSLLE